MNASQKDFFPDIITDLPAAEIPIEGLGSHLLQGADKQVVFMSFDKDVEVATHSHAGQWGVVLEGQSQLTVDGRTLGLTKGDTYYIPKGVPHSAVIKAGYKDLTLFDQKDRYAAKLKD